MTDRRASTPRRRGDRRGGDRRVEPRISSSAGIRFLRAGDEGSAPLPGGLAEVSPCGLRLTLREPVPPGEKLLIEVRDHDGRCFNLLAAVIWCEARGPHAPGDWLVGCALSAELSCRRFAVLSEMVAATAAPVENSGT